MSVRHKVMVENVLLKMDTGEIKSEGGLILATAESREAMAREEAIIEQVGSTAFEDYPEDEKPKVGDKVVISRYSGKSLGKYEDGLERRVIADTGILAVILEA